MTIHEAIAELRRRHEPVPTPRRLPTDDEVADVERALGLSFPRDYRLFLLQASDVNYGVLEPATIATPGAHTDLMRVAQRARTRCSVPSDLVPMCEDNGDYYCMTPQGSVILWAHDVQAPSGEEWPDLATWIEEVWLDEDDDDDL